MVYRKELPRIKVAFAAVALMAASISAVGGTVSAATNTQNQSIDSSMSAPGQVKKESQAASDLRAGLKTLLQEHVTTNLTVNRLIVQQAPEAELQVALDAQEANSAALAGAVASVYGEKAGDAFFDLFQEHIEESNNFAEAIAAGDEEAKAEAQVELEEYLVDITDFLVAAINGSDETYATVLGLLEQHEMLINQSTETFASENFGQSKRIEIQAVKQIAVIADALASGIIANQKL